ncbi:MAG: hypothetical protein ATN33_00655 [Epulopiscium sp. Nele67-Bin001]|nr:MAG: hypothetical protein ATN33_00655 [Epulopiscium sp. Nele67-Bin001]
MNYIKYVWELANHINDSAKEYIFSDITEISDFEIDNETKYFLSNTCTKISIEIEISEFMFFTGCTNTLSDLVQNKVKYENIKRFGLFNGFFVMLFKDCDTCYIISLTEKDLETCLEILQEDLDDTQDELDTLKAVIEVLDDCSKDDVKYINLQRTSDISKIIKDYELYLLILLQCDMFIKEEHAKEIIVFTGPMLSIGDEIENYVVSGGDFSINLFSEGVVFKFLDLNKYYIIPLSKRPMKKVLKIYSKEKDKLEQFKLLPNRNNIKDIVKIESISISKPNKSILNQLNNTN